jgi:hypothetical protein
MPIHVASEARSFPTEGQELITLAQTLARDAERHALLSESLASQAERLMIAGLRQLGTPAPATAPRRSSVRFRPSASARSPFEA